MAQGRNMELKLTDTDISLVNGFIYGINMQKNQQEEYIRILVLSYGWGIFIEQDWHWIWK